MIQLTPIKMLFCFGTIGMSQPAHLAYRTKKEKNMTRTKKVRVNQMG